MNQGANGRVGKMLQELIPTTSSALLDLILLTLVRLLV